MARAKRSPRPQPGEPAPFSPELTATQQKQAASRKPIGASVVHEVIRGQGETEIQRPVPSLWWSGLAGGLSMGFSLVAEGLLRAYLPPDSWRPLVEKFGYSAGFLMVILGRQQLFTESTLTSVIPFLSRPDLRTLGQVGRLWGVVLVANILGALIFGVVVAHIHVFPMETGEAFADIGRAAMQGSFGDIFVRAIFAGWLIALMVWMIPGAEGSKVLIIILVTYLVGLGQLAHSIAGSVEALYSVAVGDADGWDYIQYFIPTLLGNIVGGVLLVAVLNHAQVVSERNKNKDKKSTHPRTNEAQQPRG